MAGSRHQQSPLAVLYDGLRLLVYPPFLKLVHANELKAGIALNCVRHCSSVGSASTASNAQVRPMAMHAEPQFCPTALGVQV